MYVIKFLHLLVLKKKHYKYCKQCWNKLQKNNRICVCKLGFLRHCYFSNCNNYVNCIHCSPNWIDEYCNNCK